MGGLNGQYITVRLYGNNSVEAGTGTLTLQKLALHCKSRVIPDEQLQALKREYANSTLEKPFLDIAHQAWTQSFAANIQSTFPLSGLSGSMPLCLVGLKASTSASSAGIRTFSSLGNNASVMSMVCTSTVPQQNSTQFSDSLILLVGSLELSSIPFRWFPSCLETLTRPSCVEKCMAATTRSVPRPGRFLQRTRRRYKETEPPKWQKIYTPTLLHRFVMALSKYDGKHSLNDITEDFQYIVDFIPDHSDILSLLNAEIEYIPRDKLKFRGNRLPRDKQFFCDIDQDGNHPLYKCAGYGRATAKRLPPKPWTPTLKQVCDQVNTFTTQHTRLLRVTYSVHFLRIVLYRTLCKKVVYNVDLIKYVYC